MIIVHAADLHIDSPLRGIGRVEGFDADVLRGATRAAFVRLVDLCIEEQAALLLLAGDVFDGTWRDFNTAEFFTRDLARLSRAGTRTILIHGNHDAQTPITKELRLPEGVRLLSSRNPEQVVFEDLGVAVTGQSYPKREVTGNLAAAYPAPAEGHLNIALLHTALEGSAQHAAYAPCSVTELAGKGYDYWALGHVHERQIVSKNPWIVYSGCAQGRHAREPGPKGCMLLRVEDGAVQSVDFHELDLLRFGALDVDASNTGNMDEALERIARDLDDMERDDRPLLLRIRLTGRTTAHASLARDPREMADRVRALVGQADQIWLEKLTLDTAAPETQEVSVPDDFLSELLAEVDRATEEPDARGAGLRTAATKFRSRLDSPPDDPEAIRSLLGEARDLLLGRLSAGEEDA